LSVAPSGRTLSGGFDPAALWPAKKILWRSQKLSGRRIVNYFGTALVDTGPEWMI